MAVICENCGGEIVVVETFFNWVSGKCTNCQMSWAWRKTKDFHDETLKAAYGEYYDAKIKEYKKRIKELTSHAAV